jgi:hypothetical protein
MYYLIEFDETILGLSRDVVLMSIFIACRK